MTSMSDQNKSTEMDPRRGTNTSEIITEESYKNCADYSGREENLTEQANLFIGDLNKDVTEEDLFKLFSQCGTVSEVQVKRSKLTKNPLGYGFVRMASHHEAQMCLETLNDRELCGRSIRIGWAQRNCKLHITNLDATVTESELTALFSTFGDVIESDTAITRTEGRQDAFAQVHFHKRENAEEAKAALNGTYVKTRAIYIDWNQSSLSRAAASGHHYASGSSSHSSSGIIPFKGYRSYSETALSSYTPHSDTPVISIYVRFEVLEDGIHITDQALYNVFQKYGRITVVAIKSNALDPNTGRETGYAFVHFESNQMGRECAARAVAGVNGVIVDGVLYTAEFSRNFRRGIGEDPLGVGYGPIGMTAYPQYFTQRMPMVMYGNNGAIAFPGSSPTPVTMGLNGGGMYASTPQTATSYPYGMDSHQDMGVRYSYPSRSSYPGSQSLQNIQATQQQTQLSQIEPVPYVSYGTYGNQPLPSPVSVMASASTMTYPVTMGLSYAMDSTPMYLPPSPAYSRMMSNSQWSMMAPTSGNTGSPQAKRNGHNMSNNNNIYNSNYPSDNNGSAPNPDSMSGINATSRLTSSSTSVPKTDATY